MASVAVGANDGLGILFVTASFLPSRENKFGRNVVRLVAFTTCTINLVEWKHDIGWNFVALIVSMIPRIPMTIRTANALSSM